MSTKVKLIQKLFISSVLFCSANAWAQLNLGLPTVELKAGIYRIQAELADTPKSREIGLMNRTSMPTNSGMLFMFGQIGRAHV